MAFLNFFNQETLYTIMSIYFVLYFVSSDFRELATWPVLYVRSKLMLESGNRREDDTNNDTNDCLLGEEERPEPKYEDKYLEDIRKLSKEFIFDENEEKLIGLKFIEFHTSLMEEEYFDKLILGPSVKYLIENSFLSNVKVFTVPVCLSRELIKIKDGDFSASDSVQQLEDAGINGDAVTEYTKRCPNKPAIVFCCNIKHAVGMAALFAQAGYKAASLVSKGVSPEQRTQMIEDLGNGNLDILTSVDIVSEGTNIPIVETAILLRPTQSLAIYLQQVGRILRKYPGKEFALVIDCVGNVSTHGMPQKDREWSLETTASDKEKAKSVFTCENCFAVFERPSTQWPVVCPECGHEHWPEDKDNGRSKEGLTVDLVEVVENENFVTKSERIKLIANASCFEDFQEIGKKMGYKPYWAVIRWQERQAKMLPRQWTAPPAPVKRKKFNISEIMKQAGIPEPDWTKRED